MYEFRTKLQHNMTLCQRVTPSRFWAKSSCKMGSFSGKKKAFWIILMEIWDLCVAFLLMRSCFAWLVIKPSNLPIMRLEMFHLWSQMDFFLDWHKLFLFLSFYFPLPLFSFLSFFYFSRRDYCDRVPSAFHPCIFWTKYNYILNYKLDIFAIYKDT